MNWKSTQLIAGRLLGFIVKKLMASQIESWTLKWSKLQNSLSRIVFVIDTICNKKFPTCKISPCNILPLWYWCRLKFCYHGFHDSWLNNIRQIDVCLIVSKFLSLGGICRPIQRRNDRRERTWNKFTSPISSPSQRSGECGLYRQWATISNFQTLTFVLRVTNNFLIGSFLS